MQLASHTLITTCIAIRFSLSDFWSNNIGHLLVQTVGQSLDWFSLIALLVSYETLTTSQQTISKLNANEANSKRLCLFNHVIANWSENNITCGASQYYFLARDSIHWGISDSKACGVCPYTNEEWSI